MGKFAPPLMIPWESWLRPSAESAVLLTDQLNFHPGTHPAFGVVTPPNLPHLYDLLGCVKRLILQNLSLRTTMILNNRIFEKSFTKGLVLMT